MTARRAPRVVDQDVDVSRLLGQPPEEARLAAGPLALLDSLGPARGRSRGHSTPVVGLIVTWAAALPALGTAVFIYFLEEHPRVLPVVAPVFSAVASASPGRSVQRLSHQ